MLLVFLYCVIGVSLLIFRRKLELVEKYAFVTKVGQKLSIFELTMATYNALFEVMNQTCSNCSSNWLLQKTLIYYLLLI